MTKTQKQFRLTAVAAALVAVFGPALADDDVAALIKPDSSISVGIGNWSKDRHQLGIYDAMRDAEAYGLIDADLVKRDDATGTWYKLKTRNFALDNREIKAEYLRQGNVGATIEYNRITRDDPNTFHTNLQGIGTTRLIQANTYSSTAADVTNQTGRFAPQTQTVGLGTVREQTNLGFFKSLLPGLDFDVTFKNEEKDGTRNWSRGGDQFGFFAVEPIDSTTRQLEAALSYTTPKLQLRGGYNGSWYRNNTSKMMVIGPVGAEKAVGGLNNTTFLSLPLDNEAHQLFLNGGYNFTKDTRGTVKLEYTRASQNDHNPFTDVTKANGYTNDLSNVNPPSSLHAQVNTTLIQLGLNSRVTKDFTLNGNLRYHNRDDQTPIFNYIDKEVGFPAYPYVRGSYKTLSGKVEGTYRLNDAYTVVGSLEEKRQDRTEPVLADGTEKEGVVPFRHKLNETTGRLELRRALTETVNGSVSWIHAKRDGSSYSLMEKDCFIPGSGAGNATSTATGTVTYGNCGPGSYDMGNKINPLNVADRERDKVRLALDWSPADALSLQFVAENGRDKYSGENAFGLQKGTTQLYSVDASWTPNDKLSFDAWYSYDKSKAEQTGFLADNNVGTRRYDLEDGADTLGLGVKWAATARLRTGANLEWVRNVGKYDSAAWKITGQPFTGGIASPNSADLPDITNKVIRLKLFSVYALNKSSDVRVDFIHERWETDDWTWQSSDRSAFALGDGTTVTANPKQVSNFVGVRYIYRF